MKFNRSVFQALTMIGQFGINMIVPIFICAFLGNLLDRKLGTDFFMILLFFIGAVAGGYNVYRFARQVYQRGSEESALGCGLGYVLSTKWGPRRRILYR